MAEAFLLLPKRHSRRKLPWRPGQRLSSNFSGSRWRWCHQ